MKIGNQMNNLLSGKVPATKPSQMAIAEKMNSQERGLDQGTRNIEDAINLGKTAEQSLSTVSDSLQRLKELAVQGKNGTLSLDDRKLIQNEVQGIKDSINDALKNTEFNQIKVLDGGFEGNVQGGPNSSQGREMKISNTSLESLGIADFDVTKEFNIEDVDKAIEQVNETRSSIGAQNNGLSRSADVNRVARENTLSARSRLDDDFEKQVMNLKKTEVLDQYKLLVQKQQMENEQKNNPLSILG